MHVREAVECNFPAYLTYRPMKNKTKTEEYSGK